MTSKTFEGVDGTRLLHIKNLGKHVTMSIEVPGQVHMGITFDPASIPALALAELEAAGLDDYYYVEARNNLRLRAEEETRRTSEAKAQAELEAEALELANAFNKTDWDFFPCNRTAEAHQWLAVARKARELAKEASK